MTTTRSTPTAGNEPRRQIAATPEAERLGLTAQDAAGLLFDRDVVAFYGDPAWAVRMAPGLCAWDQRLTVTDGLYRFEVAPQEGEATFRPVNSNGSQRGGRPIVAWLPHRIGKAEILEGQDLRPTIADDFMLIPLPDRCEPGRTYRVVFRAAEL